VLKSHVKKLKIVEKPSSDGTQHSKIVISTANKLPENKLFVQLKNKNNIAESIVQ